jgi:hypothetical protein
MTIEEEARIAFERECPDIAAMIDSDVSIERSMAATYYEGFKKGYIVAKGE